MDLDSLIDSAVSQFPTIKKKIGTATFLSMAKEDQHSPMIYHLKRSMPDRSKIQEMLKVLQKDSKHIGALVVLDSLLRPYHVLWHLDACLSVIEDEKKLSASLKHLLTPDSFWQGYSEIEVAAYLKRMFGKIELEPSLNDKKNADVKFPFNSKDVFVEVTVPKRYYKYVKAMQESAVEHRVFQIEAPVERASDKILGELKHFADVLDEVRSIIIINLNDTEIEDIDIEDALMGVSKLVVLTNRSTGKVETKVAREDWTTFCRDEKLGKVGAILCYKRDFALNGDVAFEKRVFALSFDKGECEPLLNLFPERKDSKP